MLFALMAVVLTLSVGAAVDSGAGCTLAIRPRARLTRLSAGARYPQTNSSDQSGAVNAAALMPRTSPRVCRNDDVLCRHR